jgi:hypothetical protein
MRVRGWVYVLSNKAMPELVKIGYSTKDPILRIAELNSTGLPYSFDLEYDVLVEGPRDVESKVHKHLEACRANKEFFKTDALSAATAIRNVLASDGKTPIAEEVHFSIPTSEQPPYEPDVQDVVAVNDECRICGAPISVTDSRCPKCFGLISHR